MIWKLDRQRSKPMVTANHAFAITVGAITVTNYGDSLLNKHKYATVLIHGSF